MRKNTGKTPMSELLQKLTRSCFVDRDALDVARTQAALWQTQRPAGDLLRGRAVPQCRYQYPQL